MSAPFPERLRQDYAAERAALPDHIVSAAGRDAALERAIEAGLPGLRDEGWRYADLRPLASCRFAPALPATGADAAVPHLPAPLEGIDRLVFVDGRLAPALSADVASLQGLRLQTGAAAGTAVAEFPDATPDERFAWLNDAFAVDAARLDVQGEARLEVLFVSRDTTAAASYPRLEIRLGAGSRLTLIERHLGGSAGALVNAAVRVVVGRDATLEHLRLHDSAPAVLFLDSLLASLGTGARYSLTQLQLGAASARSALRIDLDGEAATLDLRGLSVTDARRVHDTTIQVTHRARATTSEQLLRAIAKDRSGTSFASRVDVAATAGGADSRQSLKGLLGGPGAEVNLRPQLEISTDEVKASHGATTGAIDENMLFYLLSRGIDPSTARQLLEWAFLEDVLSRIALPTLRRQVELATLGHLGNTAAEEALR